MLRALFRPLPFLIAALIMLIAAPVAAVAWHQRQHEGRVFSGVFLNGVNIGAKTPEEVFTVAQQQTASLGAITLRLKAGDQSYDFKPAEFGTAFDPAATARIAMQIGRDGDWQTQLRDRAEVYWRGVDIGPFMRMDNGAATRRIAQIASDVDRPAIDAKLNIDFANGTASESPSQIGRSLDQDMSVRLVEAAIRARESREIVLPMQSLPPKIQTVGPAATEIQRLIGSDLIVMVPTWDKTGAQAAPVEAFRVSKAELASYVSIDTAADGTPTASFRRESFRTRIEPLSRVITATTENARFVFDDATATLKPISPSRTGRAIDVDATLQAIETAARSDSNRTVVVAVKTVEPAVPDTAQAAQLGITRLITQATTFFKGSSAARIQNVKVAAERFHGVVIPPGEMFSFNQFLGNVSAEEGFAEGLIIVGNRTEKGVGGGVCQVSTTVFQAALRAGFPIFERYPHGYRVSYYERGMGAGYDAAVFTPWADLKFRNDTTGHLLIESYYDPAKVTLTFKFYGTPDGRQVSIGKSQIGSPVPHAADLYEPDPDGELKEGQVKQVEFAVNGATISFGRTVTRGGETLIDETITSKYVPWRNVFRFGPGFTPPAGSEIVTKP
jgi:vancomycin resistance protein YoaR